MTLSNSKAVRHSEVLSYAACPSAAAQITMEKSELSLITASSTVDLLASSADWKEASETASFQTAHLRLETAKLIGQVGGVLENQKKLCKELR